MMDVQAYLARQNVQGVRRDCWRCCRPYRDMREVEAPEWLLVCSPCRVIGLPVEIPQQGR